MTERQICDLTDAELETAWEEVNKVLDFLDLLLGRAARQRRPAEATERRMERLCRRAEAIQDELDRRALRGLYP